MSLQLINLKCLFLDCQATGANPGNGHLLEIGWVSASAADFEASAASAPRAYLQKLPPQIHVPAPVVRVTGISDHDLRASISARETWQKLMQSTTAIAASNRTKHCPTVIHFSRFEEPFLRALHDQYGGTRAFPLKIVCSHGIIQRLLPGLPRKGLRAVAGYFGHTVPQLRRSREHALATAHIWCKIIELLAERTAIRTYADLQLWLASTRTAAPANRLFPMDPGLRRDLPGSPGIYRMLRSNGDLLYIGKAASLRQRVNSYFRMKNRHSEHILEMLTQARQLDICCTATSLEAAIQESDEIKRKAPPYNTALQQARRRLIFLSRSLGQACPEPSGTCVIGPLPSERIVRDLLALARSLRTARLDCELLAWQASTAPDDHCLQGGLQIFRQRHAAYLDNMPVFRAITAIGARLWRQRIEEQRHKNNKQRNPSPEDQEGDAAGTSVDEPVWTPAAVAETLDSLVRHSAVLVRRSRWLCQLSESTVCWQSANTVSRYGRMLIFRAGQVWQRKYWERRREPPLPPGYKMSLQARRLNLDLMTYDRLRITTSEIRRLLANGKDVQVRLRPKVRLRRAQLQKVLRWI